MLVTDSFVMLNNPKTGSSFCRTVLKEIHERRRRDQRLPRRIMSGRRDNSLVELLLPNTKVPHKQEKDQHGTWSQIPEHLRDREVMSVVRNPYDRFLSMYEFKWWQEHPPVPRDVLQKELPQFPELSLDEFVQLNALAVGHGRLGGREVTDVALGNQSAQFIQMFFRSPDEVLANISTGYLESGRSVDDLAPITFLRQENLNEEFAAFLSRHGYTDAEVEHALSRGRVNVTDAGRKDRNALWTHDALEYVNRQERLLLQTLAAIGIEYEAPAIG